MDYLLRAKVRAPFFVIFGLLLGLTFVCYLLVVDLAPAWNGVIDLLRSMQASLIATLLVSALVVTFLPDPRSPQFVQVHHSKITDLLTDAAGSSTLWRFRGGTGRFLRARVLPILLESSRREHKHLDVDVVLYDPENADLCNRYAKYRQDSAEELLEPRWTADRVRVEIFATIFELYRAFHSTDSLDLTVALSQTMSMFRFDISKRYVIITTEGRRSPGIRADAETFFYTSYERDLMDQLQQARQVRFEKCLNADTSYSPEAVRIAMQNLGFTQNLSQDVLKEIASVAEKKENPYR